MNPTLAHTLRSLQRNILAGIITIAPLFVTYLIFSFLLGILAKAGLPVLWLLGALFPDSRVNEPWVQFVLAILLTLIVLYLVGRVTSQVLGQRAIGLFERSLERLPVVAKIYGSVRQLIDNMMAKKETNQRVVLVEFPIAGQKSIGFLSRTMTDSVTGQELAAVLLPNAINPTSAFLQVMPLSHVIETDISMEQAMSMLLTGGAVGPTSFRFYNPGVTAPGAEPPPDTLVTVTTEVSQVSYVTPSAVLAPDAELPIEVLAPEFPPVDRPAR